MEFLFFRGGVAMIRPMCNVVIVHNDIFNKSTEQKYKPLTVTVPYGENTNTGYNHPQKHKKQAT